VERDDLRDATLALKQSGVRLPGTVALDGARGKWIDGK
jgi:hypothetical protein